MSDVRQPWEVERDRSVALGRFRDVVWDMFIRQGKTPAAIRELHDLFALAVDEVMGDFDSNEPPDPPAEPPAEAGEETT